MSVKIRWLASSVATLVYLSAWSLTLKFTQPVPSEDLSRCHDRGIRLDVVNFGGTGEGLSCWHWRWQINSHLWVCNFMSHVFQIVHSLTILSPYIRLLLTGFLQRFTKLDTSCIYFSKFATFSQFTWPFSRMTMMSKCQCLIKDPLMDKCGFFSFWHYY